LMYRKPLTMPERFALAAVALSHCSFNEFEG
jgi:hypothetical protein